MRKPYATPEQYVGWETEILKLYSSRLVYMTTVICGDGGIESRFDRHVMGNVYDELNAIKTLLDTRTHTYATKLLLERLCGILESELAAYDRRGRETRLARKLLKAQQRRSIS